MTEEQEKVANEQYKAIVGLLMQNLGTAVKNEASINTILEILTLQKAKSENRDLKEISAEIKEAIVRNQLTATTSLVELTLKLNLIPELGDQLSELLKPKPSDN